MHILLVADGRSPITRRWLDSLLALNLQVTLVSSHPCDAPEGILAMHVVPIAFSRLTAGSSAQKTSAKAGLRRSLVKTFRGVFLSARYALGPLSVRSYAQQFREIVANVKPDLVHAMRIPFEGMLASHTPPGVPLAISIWGNDLTLHAPHSRAMGQFTRQTLRRADGLHTDAQRDLRLAYDWGFSADRPGLVVPSNGGIDLERVQRVRAALPPDLEARIPKDHSLVINPRGVRAYTRTDTFFQAIPLVLAQHPKTTFLCPAMAGEAEAERWAAPFRPMNASYCCPTCHKANFGTCSPAARSPFQSPTTMARPIRCWKPCPAAASRLPVISKACASGSILALMDSWSSPARHPSWQKPFSRHWETPACAKKPTRSTWT